jgi:hypothetical protein
MQSVWVVGSASDIMQIPLTESLGYLTYGGNVFGSATQAPNLYEYFNGTTKCGPIQTYSNMTRRSYY